MDKNNIVIVHVKKNNDSLIRIQTLMSKIEFSYDIDMTDYELYVKKLNKYAEILVVQVNGKDVGIIAFYANDYVKKAAFVTYIGVLKEFQGSIGITKSLVLSTESYAKNKQMKDIIFNVNKSNRAMIALAKRNNCMQIKIQDTFIMFKKKL